MIICNKEDIRGESRESEDDLVIEEIARDLGVSAWTRTSAKTGAGVEEGIRLTIIDGGHEHPLRFMIFTGP